MADKERDGTKSSIAIEIKIILWKEELLSKNDL